MLILHIYYVTFFADAYQDVPSPHIPQQTLLRNKVAEVHIWLEQCLSNSLIISVAASYIINQYYS